MTKICLTMTQKMPTITGIKNYQKGMVKFGPMILKKKYKMWKVYR